MSIARVAKNDYCLALRENTARIMANIILVLFGE